MSGDHRGMRRQVPNGLHRLRGEFRRLIGRCSHKVLDAMHGREQVREVTPIAFRCWYSFIFSRLTCRFTKLDGCTAKCTPTFNMLTTSEKPTTHHFKHFGKGTGTPEPRSADSKCTMSNQFWNNWCVLQLLNQSLYHGKCMTSIEYHKDKSFIYFCWIGAVSRLRFLGLGLSSCFITNSGYVELTPAGIVVIIPFNIGIEGLVTPLCLLLSPSSPTGMLNLFIESNTRGINTTMVFFDKMPCNF